MLFRARFKKEHGLLQVRNKGDKTIFSHVQNIDLIKERVKRLKAGTEKGWSHGKNFKLIASIPELEMYNHPEFATDEKALHRWLNTEEGMDYKVSNP